MSRLILAVLLAGAAFPIDASGAPPTISGMIHQWAGFNFVVVIAAALLFGRSFARLRPGPWARRVGFSAWLLAASGTALVVFMGPLHDLGVGGRRRPDLGRRHHRDARSVRRRPRCVTSASRSPARRGTGAAGTRCVNRRERSV